VIRAVIDTNVFVSAMISRNGNEALVLTAINQGLVVPCLSPDILAEYRDVLARPRFGFSTEDVAALLEMLCSQESLHQAIAMVRVSPDPEDDRFIACALASKAQFLVTGNKRHFPQTDYEGVKVVNAVELLEFITLEM